MFQAIASKEKNDAIFVKVENESDGVDIMKYDCPPVASTSADTPSDPITRLMSELSSLRQKHYDGIYELERTKELVSNLQAEKQRLLQTIESNEQAIHSLSTGNKASQLRTVEAERNVSMLCHEKNHWMEEKKHLESSIATLCQENLVAIESAKSNDKANDRLRNELKALQARLKQNLSGTDQNKRYFDQPSVQEIANSYDVKQLLAHRKKSTQLEFKVQWKDTWVKESDLNCPKLQSAYWLKHK